MLYRAMNFFEEMSEDDLTQYLIQLSIQESCQDAFIKSEASLNTVTDANLRVMAAIEQGEVSVLRKMLCCTSVFRELDSRGWLPLHRAAAQPIPEVLDIVLCASQGQTLEERTTMGGETPLTLAAKAGLLENVKTLLEHGASPHNTNSRNESPLLLAVKAGSYEMAYTLIASGAGVEQICRRKWTSMHEAAKVGCSEVMMLLLRHGGQVNQKDNQGVTPLNVAAECAHVHILDILLRYGSRINNQAFNGESVLTDAAGSGSVDCVDLLLKNGANPNLPSLSGQLPIHKAAYEGHYNVLKMLIPITTRKAIKLSGQSPIHSAADGNHFSCVKLLIENSFDVNSLLNPRISDKYMDMRRTALFFAVSNGDIPCIEMLLNAGAKPDLDPLRCLLVAVRAGRYEIVKMLLASQADVNCYFTVVSDTVFPTALQYCLRDEMMMRLLLNSGYEADKCFSCNHDNRLSLKCADEEQIPFCEFMSLSCLMDLSGDVVRILLDYVSHVPVCSQLKYVLQKQKEWPDICDTLGNPRSLKHMCRLEIRKRLTLKRLNDPIIMSTDLFPPSLRNYLMYRENDLYGQSVEVIL